MAGGEHIVSHYQKAACEIVKRFMTAIVFTKTPLPIMSHEEYSIVNNASKLDINAQDDQQVFAGASAASPSVCQFPRCPWCKINLQTKEAVNIILFDPSILV